MIDEIILDSLQERLQKARSFVDGAERNIAARQQEIAAYQKALDTEVALIEELEAHIITNYGQEFV